MTTEPDKYRFSGYEMPKIQLDSTGDSYIHLPKSMIHPEISKPQPYYFKKPYYFEAVGILKHSTKRKKHN